MSYASRHAEITSTLEEPELDTPAWVRERALRGLVALEESDPDVVREVLEALANYTPTKPMR